MSLMDEEVTRLNQEKGESQEQEQARLALAARLGEREAARIQV